jgi:hypothetical protein
MFYKTQISPPFQIIFLKQFVPEGAVNGGQLCEEVACDTAEAVDKGRIRPTYTAKLSFSKTCKKRLKNNFISSSLFFVSLTGLLYVLSPLFACICLLPWLCVRLYLSARAYLIIYSPI